MFLSRSLLAASIKEHVNVVKKIVNVICKRILKESCVEEAMYGKSIEPSHTFFNNLSKDSFCDVLFFHIVFSHCLVSVVW